MAKKLHFEVLGDEDFLGTRGSRQDNVKRLYKNFIYQLKHENLAEIAKNFKDDIDAKKKLIDLFNIASELDTDKNEKFGASSVELAHKLYNTAIKADAYNILETVKKEMLVHKMERNKDRFKTDLEKTGINDTTFQNDILTEIIDELSNCRSIFRGSSEEFENIINGAKAMKAALKNADKKGIDAKSKNAAISILAENLVGKMDEYVGKRMDVAIKYGSDSYKGKRVDTMNKLSAKLGVFINSRKAEVHSNISKNTGRVLEEVFNNTKFDAKLYNVFVPEKLSDEKIEMFEKAIGDAQYPAVWVRRASRQIDQYNTFVNDAITNQKDDVFNTVMSMADPKRKNLDYLGSMFEDDSRKVTLSHVTGNRELDRMIIAKGAKNMEENFKSALLDTGMMME